MDNTLFEKSTYLHQQSDIGIYYCGKREKTINHVYGPEIRNHYLFVFVKKGNAVLHGENGDISFGDHDMLVMFPEKRVHYHALTEWSINYVGLYGKAVDDMMTQMGVTAENPIIHINCFDEIFKIFSDIYNISILPQSYKNDLEITKLIYEFFIHLFSNQKNLSNIDLVYAAVRTIDLNYNSSIKITDIASRFYITPVYLGKIFKERIGISPKQYIIKKRIERAKELLANTNLAVNEISNSVGYTDQLYFSRIFKVHCKLSPLEYRKNQKLNTD